MNTEPRNHIHPFSSIQELENSGVIEIASSQGVFITDSNGKSYLDAMAGLWCVNVGYGREELVFAAEAQMRSLPYYNTFFGTTNQPVSRLSQVLAEITPDHINSFFYANSGSEGNDTIVRLLRYYWQIKGCHKKTGFISRIGSYHGSTMVCASLGGMSYMHLQGVLPPVVRPPNYYGFSVTVCVRSKALFRRHSCSTSRKSNEVCGRRQPRPKGVTESLHGCVAALTNGTTIGCERRLTLNRL